VAPGSRSLTDSRVLVNSNVASDVLA
jgi:hypothetical protein